VGQPLNEVIEDWAKGVVTNQQVDDIPLNASPRGRNSALIPIAGNRASVMKRRGMRTINTTAITGTPAIIGQLAYHTSAGTLYHLLISDAGRLDRRNSDTTTSAADAVTPAPFTAGTLFPDSAVANYLAYICNGSEQKKFNGTSVQKWGITAPSAAPTLTDSGVAGVHDGTYEGYITYYNSNADVESSPSPTSSTLTLVTNQIDFAWLASADSQVTHVRVYVRNTATQPFFYRIATVAIGTLTVRTNTTDANLVVKGPTSGDNDPPPATTKFCEWHLSRMFISDGTDVFYSDENKPEGFNPENTLPGLNREEGEDITALHASRGVLIVTKTTKTYLLIGDHPDNWRVEILDPSIGCVSARSMTTVEGVARWWSKRGLVEWEGDSLIHVGQILIAPTISPDAINHDELLRVCAADDPTRERIVIALPAVGKDRNTIYLPYSYRLRCFESDGWTAIDAASLCTVDDSGTPSLYAGGYEGQVFRWWDADNDGVATSTTASGTVTSATATSLTCSSATFDTTGAGLTDRYVVVIDPAGTKIQRRRIASNTGTVLTLATGEDFTDTPTNEWTFTVGGIDFAWDTRWMTGTIPFIRKRYRFFYFLGGSSESSASFTMSVFVNFADDPSFSESIAFVAEDEVAEWDLGEWDVATFGAVSSVYKKVRVARKGRAWRMRLENREPDEPIVLHKVGAACEVLTDKNP
jgi:hypothetical protein